MNKITIMILLFAFFLSNQCLMADPSVFNEVSTAIEHLSDTFTSQYVTFQDLRISPTIRCEQWQEVPMEVSVLTPEDQIVPDLKKISQLQDKGKLFVAEAAYISVSAETLKVTGKPLLTVSLLTKLYFGNLSANSALSKGNERLANALSAILKYTSFTPQVKKGVSMGEKQLRGKHWVTNVRIDNSGRIDMTGYAFDLKFVTKLGAELLKTKAFSEIYIKFASKNTYEKVPVWRFDMSGSIK